jgi:hypothetical protein
MKFSEVINYFKNKHIEWIFNENKRFKNWANLIYADLIATGILKGLAIFRKNLALIFKGLKDFAFNSNTVRLKNK